jgi:hypothetical protein
VEDVAVPATVPDRSGPVAFMHAHQRTSSWSEPALILRL